MANTDKNIIITPNSGSANANPNIVFSGASANVGPQNVTLTVTPDANGTLSFDASSGNLLVIQNDLSNTIYTDGTITANTLVTANLTSQNLSGGNLISANYVVGNVELRVGDVDTENWSRIRHLQSSNAYGFTSELGDFTVITDEEAAVKQAIVLADVNPGSSNTLFGVSIYSGNNSGPSTGNEVWTPVLNLSSSGNLTTIGNISAGNSIAGNFFVGDGGFLSNIQGANVSSIANANYANFAGQVFTANVVTDNAQPNITSVGNLTGLTVSGNLSVQANITTGNINGGNLAYANYILGTNDIRIGNLANSSYSRIQHLNTSNVVYGFQSQLGQMTVITNEESPIQQALVLADTDVGNPNTLFGLSVFTGNTDFFGNPIWYNVFKITGTGNLSFGPNPSDGNILLGGNLTASSGIFSGSISAGSLNITGTTNLTGNISAASANFSGSLTAGATTLSGNLVTTNANLGNLATANFFQGDGYLLTNLTIQAGSAIVNGNSNVQVAPNANVTISANGQPNVVIVTGQKTIISTDVDITSGNVSVTGDLGVTGNVTAGSYSNANTNLKINTTSIGLSANGVNNVLVVSSSDATFSGNLTSLGNLSIAGNANLNANLSVSSNITSGNISAASGQFTGNLTAGNANLGNLARANFFQGDGYLLTNLTIQTGTSIINGNSNVLVQPNGNVLFTVNGTANTMIVGENQTTISGNLSVSGNTTLNANTTASNLTVNSNFVIPNTGTANANTTVSVRNLTTYTAGVPGSGAVSVAGNLGVTGISFLNQTYFDGAVVSNSGVTFKAGVGFDTNAPVTIANTLGVTGNTSLGNLSATKASFGNITITGNITAGNINGGNAVTANFFVGDGSFLSNINASNIGVVPFANYANFAGEAFNVAAANVTGTVANATFATTAGSATTANTVTNNAQPNITSLGTLTGLTSTGNINFANASNVNFAGAGVIRLGTVANVKLTGGDDGFILRTDGEGNLSWVSGTTAVGLAGANKQVQFNNNNTFGASANFTFDRTSNTLYADELTSKTISSSGNANVGNISATNGVFTNVLGNGAAITSITGANVTGTVANATFATSATSANTANTASTVTSSSQPNITSVGTLTGISVSGNANVSNLNTGFGYFANDAIVSGNLFVNGNLTYVNVDTLAVEDPIIELGTGPNGALPVANSGKDVGTALNYYDTAAKQAFMGWDVSNSEIAFGSNVSITNEIVTFNQLANVRAGNILTTEIFANTVNATGNITASYFFGNGSQLTGIGSSNTAQTVTNNAQPNITSVGTLTSLSVSGNADVGNVNANNGVFTNISGNGYQITGVTALTSQTVTNNAQPNITSVGTLTSLSVSGNVTASYFFGNGSQLTGVAAGTSNTAQTVTNNAQPNITSVGTLTSLSVSGNANVGNIGATNGVFTNVSGNGSQLAGIVGANVTGTVANATYATQAGTAATVTNNAQPNITSVGILTSLSVNGNITAGNINGGNTTQANYIVGTSEVRIGNVPSENWSRIQHLTTSNAYGFDSPLGQMMVLTNEEATVKQAIVLADATTSYSSPMFGVSVYEGNNSGPSTGNETWVPIFTVTGTGDISTAGKITSGSLSVIGNANIGNIGTAGLITATGNIRGGNLVTTGIVSTSGNVVAANVSASGNITANYFIGNGSLITGISAGTANTAQTVTNNAQPNITSVGTLTSLSVSGNANVGNIGATNGVFTNVSGNGAALSSINGANVTGTVANAAYATNAGTATTATTASSATTAGTVTSASQPNITSVGTLTSLSVIGNANVGNLGTAGLISAAGNITGNFFIGNGSQLTGVAAGTATTAQTVTNAAQPNITSVGTLTSLSVSGNANVGNIGATNGVFTNVSGNGALLTDLNGSNITTGQVNNARLNTLANTTDTTQGRLIKSGDWGFATTAFASGNLTDARYNYSQIFRILSSETTGPGISGGGVSMPYDSTPTTTYIVAGGGGFEGRLFTGYKASANGTPTWYEFLRTSSTGNANLGNLGVSGLITATGAITGGSLSTAGALSVGANANVGNLGTAGIITAAGTITGGNLSTAGNISAGGTLSVTGNANVGNLGVSGLITATGNIQGGNLRTTGQLSVGGNANVGNLGTTGVFATTLSATGNANVGNIGATNGVFTNVSGNGAGLTSLPSANITGQVANALVAGTVYTNAQPNITSVGTLTSLSVSGNSNIGNIGVTGVFATTLSATSNANVGNLGTAGLITATGNIQGGNLRTTGQLSVGGNANVGNLGTTGVFATTLSATGNANVGNIGATNGVFTNISGNGAGLTSINGSNVTGQVANALVAGTVYTNAQPNITSVGTLGSLSVTGTATIDGNVRGGNLVTSGNANVGNLGTSGLITSTGNVTVDGNIRGGNLVTSGNANVGNLGFSSGVITGTGNISAGFFIGNGSQLTGVAAGTATTAQTVTTNAQPNITSVGTLTSLSVSGNANVGNIGGTNGVFTNVSGNGALLTNLNASNLSSGTVLSGRISGNYTGVTGVGALVVGSIGSGFGNVNIGSNIFTGNGSGLTAIPAANISGQVANALIAGTVYTNAQPNITSVGTLTSLSVSGNANIGNIGTAGLITATGNITGGNLSAGGSINAGTTVSITSAGTPAAVIGIGTGQSSGPGGVIRFAATGNVAYIQSGIYSTVSNSNAALAFTTINAGAEWMRLDTNGNLGINTASPTSKLHVVGTANITGAAIFGSTISATGNVTAPNFIGNLFGNWAGPLANGTSNVAIPTANGNVNISSAGNANIVVVTGTGANVNGYLSVSGNANIGNLGTGIITATGTITGGNLSTAGNISAGGTLSITGNANVGNLGTAGLITATGNIQGGNLRTTGQLSVGGNANVGNIGTAGLITATGTITGGNLSTAGNISAGGTLSITGNANVGNLGTAGLITATGNIQGGNLRTTGQLSVGGNANVGNLGTTGVFATTLSATGNVTGGNFIGCLANGTTSICIPAAGGNINFTIGGQANEMVFTSTGANINGYLTADGNLTITGNARRIRGDFNNANLSNRLIFQAASGNDTSIIALPANNLTGTEQTNFAIFNKSDVGNSAYAVFAIDGNRIQVGGSITGTGTNLPLLFITSGTEAARFDTSQNLLVGTTNSNGANNTSTSIIGGIFQTIKGSVSPSSGVATTLFTLPNVQYATWIVTVGLNAADTPNYSAIAFVATQGTSTRLLSSVNGTLLTITLSGLNVQSTQSSGIVSTIYYSAIRIM